MKSTVLGILVVLALLVAGGYFLTKKEAAVPVPVVNSYENQQFGVSFTYPEGYVLTERSLEDRYAITVVREEDALPPENGEGPTAITVEVFTNASTTEDWLATNASNYQLGGGTYLETSVASAPALRYGWSGLYEGETTAFVHEGRVIAVSVTYLTPQDQIRADYEALLASMSLK